MDPAVDFRHPEYDHAQDFSIESTQVPRRVQWQVPAGSRPQQHWNAKPHAPQPAYQSHPQSCVAVADVPMGHKVHPTLLILVDRPPERNSLDQHERTWNPWGLRELGHDEDTAESAEPAEADDAPEQDESFESPQWRYYSLEARLLDSETQERSYKQMKHKRLFALTMATRKGKYYTVPKPVDVPWFKNCSQGIYGAKDMLGRCSGPLRHQLAFIDKQFSGAKFCELKIKAGRHIIPQQDAKDDWLPVHPILLRNFLFLYKAGGAAVTFDPSLMGDPGEAFLSEVMERMEALGDRSSSPFRCEYKDKEFWDLVVKDQKEYRLQLQRAGTSDSLELVWATSPTAKYYVCDVMSCPAVQYDKDTSEECWEAVRQANTESMAKYEEMKQAYEKRLQESFEQKDQEGSAPVPRRPPAKPVAPRERRGPGAVYHGEPAYGLRFALSAALALQPCEQPEETRTMREVGQERSYRNLVDYIAEMRISPKGAILAPAVGRHQIVMCRRKVQSVWTNGSIQVAVSTVKQQSTKDTWDKTEIDITHPGWAEALAARPIEPQRVLQAMPKFIEDALYLLTGKAADSPPVEPNFAIECAEGWMEKNIEAPKRAEEEEKALAQASAQQRKARLEANGFYRMYTYPSPDDPD